MENSQACRKWLSAKEACLAEEGGREERDEEGPKNKDKEKAQGGGGYSDIFTHT